MRRLALADVQCCPPGRTAPSWERGRPARMSRKAGQSCGIPRPAALRAGRLLRNAGGTPALPGQRATLSRSVLAILVLAAAALPGCGAAPSRRAPAATITVYAAASLTEAFDAIGDAFRQREPGIAVRINYGASSTLRTQIEQGAPADVFASADSAQMDSLARTGRVLAPAVFARSRLVVAAPAASQRVSRLSDLAGSGVRLVATPEAVPIGRYTRQVLERLARLPGMPPDYLARVQANVVSREPNVRSLVARVELGEADAAIVYATDTSRGEQRGRLRLIPIPAQANVTAEYPIAAVAGVHHRTVADRFIAFVRSPEGQSVLRRHGFE